MVAVKSGKVAGAALDVYDAEPLPEDAELRKLPQVVMTPHLGASTKEAQESVGLEVAEAVTDYLVNGTVRNAVNMPSLDAKTYEAVKPYLELGEKLGRLVAQLAPNRKGRKRGGVHASRPSTHSACVDIGGLDYAGPANPGISLRLLPIGCSTSIVGFSST